MYMRFLLPILFLFNSFAPNAIAQVIFQDGFESGDLTNTSNGFSWTGSVKTNVNNTNPRSGSYALEFTYPAVPDGSDSFSEQRFSLGGNYTDIWVRYDIFIPSNYFHREQTGSSANNKGFLYLWSGQYGSPSGPGMGPNFWPASSSDGASSASFYIWGPIDKHYWSNWPVWSGIPIETSDIGKWMEVVLHYKYATAANNDGVAEIWKKSQGKDRVKILEITDGNWYQAGQPGFDQGYLLGWSNSGFDEETKIYIDNIIFSDSAADVLNPPSPPSVTIQ